MRLSTSSVCLLTLISLHVFDLLGRSECFPAANHLHGFDEGTRMLAKWASIAFRGTRRGFHLKTLAVGLFSVGERRCSADTPYEELVAASGRYVPLLNSTHAFWNEFPPEARKAVATLAAC